MLWPTFGLVLILTTAPGQFLQHPEYSPKLAQFLPHQEYSLRLAQLPAKRKPHDRGNCFRTQNCRGDSIGATWVPEPDLCKAIGGQSWMNYSLKCYNLRAGPQGLI